MQIFSSWTSLSRTHFHEFLPLFLWWGINKSPTGYSIISAHLFFSSRFHTYTMPKADSSSSNTVFNPETHNLKPGKMFSKFVILWIQLLPLADLQARPKSCGNLPDLNQPKKKKACTTFITCCTPCKHTLYVKNLCSSPSPRIYWYMVTFLHLSVGSYSPLWI